MASPPTKSSTLRLSEVARHVVAPEGIASTSWPSVRDKCLDLGITFRDWQHPTGQLILAKRADGKYASTIGGTGLSIPRQVGKTFLVGSIVFALCLLRPGLTVIWTSHRLRTAEETFGKMQTLAQRKKIAPFVSKLVLGSGEEEVQFANGSRILFGARERGFGRGFDEVDVLIFDEAQILGDAALDDMIPATNQSRQSTGALLLFMGTPPKPTDPGEVFYRMRSEALSGEDLDTGWVEFGADPGFTPTPAPAALTAADWKQIAKANPSFPEDTPRDAILRMRKKLGPESFLREGLGIWDERDVVPRVIPEDVWSALAVDADAAPAQDTPPDALAADMSHERVLSIAGCWRRADGTSHVEILALDIAADTSDAIAWLTERAGRRIPVLIDHYSPAASMIPELKARRVKVVTVSTGPEMSKACGGFYDDVTAGRLSHANQPQLDAAVAGGVKRKIGDAGGWGWDRKDPSVNLAPLVSVTLAHAGAANKKPKRKSTQRVTVMT